jgi:hypothetical protein
MEFLLILSAMLSAVTGAFTGTRAPDARPHHQAAAAGVAEVAQQVAVAPAPALPSEARPVPRSRGSAALSASAVAPPAAFPLYADRLIE